MWDILIIYSGSPFYCMFKPFCKLLVCVLTEVGLVKIWLILKAIYKVWWIVKGIYENKWVQTFAYITFCFGLFLIQRLILVIPPQNATFMFSSLKITQIKKCMQWSNFLLCSCRITCLIHEFCWFMPGRVMSPAACSGGRCWSRGRSIWAVCIFCCFPPTHVCFCRNTCIYGVRP